ncbi:MAG TPA: acyl-[acyl-carrier-protein]--UDP-N-acetylglucosamine O-acyltransferase, partial [Caulobacteraceae bacterium]|nr:acyl-[acyl-carrier-protein]--UDP-N-acetylglucosamine O-acyltransferase [Caulobacteraceae bacterium]
NHAKLEGLNLVGLKRRGFSRDEINTLRAAFRDIFLGADRFADRVAVAAETYRDSPQVMEIIEFVRAEPARPLAPPARNAPE